MRLITVAIHTYEYALGVKSLLESEGIEVTLQNVNLEQPEVSSGVRVRIPESDLPLALRILENREIFGAPVVLAGDGAAKRHTIVVPTDFSEHAFRALCVAVRLASRHNADIMLLHSYIGNTLPTNVQLTDNLTYEVQDLKDNQELERLAGEMMHKLLGRLKTEMKSGRLPVVKCDWSVVEGVPEDSIVEYARVNPPYLVVMGTRACEHKDRDMIGSVTAEVLDESRFSVLTIPENMDASGASGPYNVLFFSNLDRDDILALDTLYRYFPDARARVTIVNVPRRLRFSVTDRSRSALALADYCRKKFEHFTFETVPMSAADAAQELDKLQADNNFDLIVVANRRKNAFSRLFNPGLAHKIVFESDIPMLVIPV